MKEMGQHKKRRTVGYVHPWMTCTDRAGSLPDSLFAQARLSSSPPSEKGKVGAANMCPPEHIDSLETW
jgi:hypothetical protein